MKSTVFLSNIVNCNLQTDWSVNIIFLEKTKKELIKDSALELFSLHGYKGVTADSIIEHAGVSKGLLFHHFKNMRGLVGVLLLDWLIPRWENILELKTDGKELWECVDQIFNQLRHNLIENEGHYRLYYTILLNEPTLFSELEVDKLASFQKMTSFIQSIFSERDIKNAEQEAILLSTSIMGLALQYCITQHKASLLNFDISKNLILERYKMTRPSS